MDPKPSRVIGILFLTRVLTCSAQVGPATSLCALFQGHEKYNGKMVTVRGTLNASVHGIVLANERCFPRGSRYKTFENAAAINLETPGQDSEPGIPKPKFDIDAKSYRLLRELAEKKLSHGEAILISITCNGLVRSAENFRLEGDAASGYKGNGFGHMGMYPVELVIESIKDTEIKNVSH